MKFKYFTDKDNGQSVAINPEAVKFVVDMGYGPTVHFLDGSIITIEGKYLEVVAQLSA